MFTWGCGRHGKLGHGNTDSEWLPRRLAALISFHIAHASAGHDHSAAVDKGNGYVWTWGKAETGKLGVDSDEFDATRPRRVTGFRGCAKQVECGRHHTLIVASARKPSDDIIRLFERQLTSLLLQSAAESAAPRNPPQAPRSGRRAGRPQRNSYKSARKRADFSYSDSDSSSGASSAPSFRQARDGVSSNGSSTRRGHAETGSSRQSAQQDIDGSSPPVVDQTVRDIAEIKNQIAQLLSLSTMAQTHKNAVPSFDRPAPNADTVERPVPDLKNTLNALKAAIAGGKDALAQGNEAQLVDAILAYANVIESLHVLVEKGVVTGVIKNKGVADKMLAAAQNAAGKMGELEAAVEPAALARGLAGRGHPGAEHLALLRQRIAASSDPSSNTGSPSPATRPPPKKENKEPAAGRSAGDSESSSSSDESEPVDLNATIQQAGRMLREAKTLEDTGDQSAMMEAVDKYHLGINSFQELIDKGAFKAAVEDNVKQKVEKATERMDQLRSMLGPPGGMPPPLPPGMPPGA
jgi:hypothetical protein